MKCSDSPRISSSSFLYGQTSHHLHVFLTIALNGGNVWAHWHPGTFLSLVASPVWCQIKAAHKQFVSHLFPYLTAQNRCPLPVRTWSCQLHHPNKETFLNISSSHAGFFCFFFFGGGGWSGSGHGRRADGRWLYHPGTAHHLRDGGGVFRIVFFSEVQGIIYIEFLHCSFIT